MNHKGSGNDPTDTVSPADASTEIPAAATPHREEALLDEAVEETFPASDPISPHVAARMEPADVQWDEISTNGSARMTDRMWRNAPALVAIGTAAVALLAMRALRGGPRRLDDADYD
jgi:hypothetical protein